MDTLAALQITNFEQFLRKKSSTDHPLVNRLAHYLPVHWLRTDPNKITLEITLYEGVITKKWSVKQTYKRLVELKLMGHSPRALLTWPGDLNITADEFNPAWYKSCTRISHVQDIVLRSFQLTFLNKGFLCNRLAAKFLPISPMCVLCKEYEETFIHLYWECTKIRPLIIKLKQFMIDYLEIDPQQFNACYYLLSNFSSTAAVVTATLFKRHILITKINKKDSNDPQVSFLEFLIVLHNYIKKDWLRAVYACQQTQFVTFWGMLSVDAVLEEFDNLG